MFCLINLMQKHKTAVIKNFFFLKHFTLQLYFGIIYFVQGQF